jgi:glutamyl-tRNA reductase
MRIGFQDWLPDQTPLRAFTGREAYEYLLEVICGLHSPMPGETEVFGQFRERVKSLEDHPRFSKILGWLVTDAKEIRQKHLTNLGAHSYGSLTRKYTRDFDRLAILGAGKLAREIMPWLKQKSAVEIYSRCPSEKRPLFAAFPNADVKGAEAAAASHAKALIVAAPLESNEVERWISRFCPRLELLLDLRETEPLRSPQWTTLGLMDFFSELNTNQDQIRARIHEAQEAVKGISQTRLRAQEIRPFGWDDLCA